MSVTQEEKKSPKPVVIAFTGGGTLGHIYPGLAVIEELRELLQAAGVTHRFVWIGGRKKEADRKAVEAAGIEFLSIPTGKLRRNFSLENILDFFRVLAGFFSSIYLLKKLKPVLLFSKGGYVSVPPCLAAQRLGIPYCIHESDASPGLATRITSTHAQKIFVSYTVTKKYFAQSKQEKICVSGNPIRKAISFGDAERGRAFLNARADLPLILFWGGSLGASQINELLFAVLPQIVQRATVVQQSGSAITEYRATIEKNRQEFVNYRHFETIGKEVPDVLAAADLIVSRAGAGSLWEAAALGKPMILIPLCGAGTRGDQVDNAKIFVEAGGAKMLLGSEATPANLLTQIEEFLGSQSLCENSGQALRQLAPASARNVIAKEIFELIKTRM